VTSDQLSQIIIYAQLSPIDGQDLIARLKARLLGGTVRFDPDHIGTNHADRGGEFISWLNDQGLFDDLLNLYLPWARSQIGENATDLRDAVDDGSTDDHAHTEHHDESSQQ
jgi:hypothetical protein